MKIAELLPLKIYPFTLRKINRLKGLFCKLKLPGNVYFFVRLEFVIKKSVALKYSKVIAPFIKKLSSINY